MFLQKAAAVLRQLEQQKAAVQKEIEPLVSRDTKNPVSSSLPERLNQTKNKQDSLAGLNDLYTKKYAKSLAYKTEFNQAFVV